MLGNILFCFKFRTVTDFNRLDVGLDCADIFDNLFSIFLGEKVSTGRWFAVGIGFVGLLFVTNPFGDGFSWAMTLPLMTAGFVAVRDLITRKIDTEIHSVYIVLATLLFVGIAGGFISVLEWRPVSMTQLGWLGLASVLLSVGFFNQIKAVRMGELSFIAPFLFTGILVSIFWGYIVWNNVPTFTMMIGVVLIIGSGLYVLKDQTMTKRKLRTMQPH